jgi:heat-inducible transcriptional repressor
VSDPIEARRAEILRAIVEEHIKTAQPVGSQTVAQSARLGVSSATVRNDMTVLERDGYLVQPHTSAGRIPTDLGYRYFVDHFAEEGPLDAPDRRAVADFFASAHRALEDLLHETSQFLSRVTDHAAVIVGPQVDAAHVRNVQLVTLQPAVVIMVTVLSNGAVEQQVLELEHDVDDDHVRSATAALDAALRGHTLLDVPVVATTGSAEADRLVLTARTAFLDHVATGAADPLYVGGTSRLAAEHESAARLLEMLEQQVVVVSLVRNILDQGITVRIGSENEIDELSACSLVLAPYRVEGEVAGTVGVLGPTRMDYRQALAAVAAVSQQLGHLLS